ncbi:5223_t:CDS:2, partial [Gigaspora margarita]
MPPQPTKLDDIDIPDLLSSILNGEEFLIGKAKPKKGKDQIAQSVLIINHITQIH